MVAGEQERTEKEKENVYERNSIKLGQDTDVLCARGLVRELSELKKNGTSGKMRQKIEKNFRKKNVANENFDKDFFLLRNLVSSQI